MKNLNQLYLPILILIYTICIGQENIINSDTSNIFSEIKAVHISEIKPYWEKQHQIAYVKNSDRSKSNFFIYNKKESKISFFNKNDNFLGEIDLASYNLYRPSHYKWNHKGTSVAYTYRERNFSYLYMLNIDGTIIEIDKISSNDKAQILQPSWSFDDNYITYLVSSRVKGHSIYIKGINILKDIIVESTPLGTNICGNPTWFNTKLILTYKIYNQNRKGELWSFDLIKHKNEYLHIKEITSIYPLISPNDLYIAISVDGQFTILNNSEKTLSQINIPGSAKLWSPNSKYIASQFTEFKNHDGLIDYEKIYVTNISDGKNRDLTISKDKLINAFTWLNDTLIVYY